MGTARWQTQHHRISLHIATTQITGRVVCPQVLIIVWVADIKDFKHGQITVRQSENHFTRVLVGVADAEAQPVVGTADTEFQGLRVAGGKAQLVITLHHIVDGQPAAAVFVDRDKRRNGIRERFSWQQHRAVGAGGCGQQPQQQYRHQNG